MPQRISDGRQQSPRQTGPLQQSPAELGVAQIAAAQIGLAQIRAAQVGAIETGAAQVSPLQLHLLHQRKAEISSLKISTPEIRQLIEAGAEVRLHQPGLPPAAAGRHDPAQATAMQQGGAEISLLQPGAGEVGFMPLGAAGPQGRQVSPPEQGLLKTAALHTSPLQAGPAEAGFLEAAAGQLAAGEIEIDPIQIRQPQTWKAALASGQRLTQSIESGGNSSHGETGSSRNSEAPTTGGR